MGSWSEAILQKAQEVTSGLTLLNFLFQYDNVLMEEAAQILEIETFIPLLLQVGKEVIVFALDYALHARGDSKGKWDFKRERDRRAWEGKRKPPSRHALNFSFYFVTLPPWCNNFVSAVSV